MPKISEAVPPDHQKRQNTAPSSQKRASSRILLNQVILHMCPELLSSNEQAR